MAITVTDVAPVISSGAAGSVTEGVAAGSTVYTAAASDVAGGTVTYSLSGTDASAFTINAGTGVVTINAIPNYESKSGYSINVVASDGTLTSTQAVTVAVTDVAPVITSAATALSGNGARTGTGPSRGRRDDAPPGPLPQAIGSSACASQ